MKLKKVREEKKPKEHAVDKVVLNIEVSVTPAGTLVTLSDPDGVWRVVQEAFLFTKGKPTLLDRSFSPEGSVIGMSPLSQPAQQIIMGTLSPGQSNHIYNSDDRGNALPLMIPLGPTGKVEVLLSPSSPAMRKEYGSDLVGVVEALYTAYKSCTGYNFTLLVEED